MTRVLRAVLVALILWPAAACAGEEPPPGGEKRMRREDRLVLVLAIVGSIASVAVGGFVHWKLLRGGGEEKK